MILTKILSLLALLLALACCREQTLAPADHPRLTPNVTMRDITFHSASLGREMAYRVIVPAVIAPSQKLPAVYLLHGADGNFRDWSNYSDVARFAEQGLILVMPEGDNSYYTNATDRPADRYEDYIVKDLISDVESQFPVSPLRSNRAIVGVSMGGFGAVNLSLKHPELFIFAAGISSAIDVPGRPFSIKRLRQYRGHAAIFGPWGSQSRRENDPFVLAQTVEVNRMPYLYLTCGNQEGLLPANRRFAELLKQRHFQYEFHAGVGGHDWNQWNGRLKPLFESLIRQL